MYICTISWRIFQTKLKCIWDCFICFSALRKWCENRKIKVYTCQYYVEAMKCDSSTVVKRKKKQGDGFKQRLPSSILNPQVRFFNKRCKMNQWWVLIKNQVTIHPWLVGSWCNKTDILIHLLIVASFVVWHVLPQKRQLMVNKLICTFISNKLIIQFSLCMHFHGLVKILFHQLLLWLGNERNELYTF